tara:strand:- start:352 stop:894 length:543 start_codon:yes stop_codon:yes gene_type:complete
MLDKCVVKIISNRVVCDNKLNEDNQDKKQSKNIMNENIKNKTKYKHLVDIGMDVENYHPTIIRNMIDGGRMYKLPDNLKPQLKSFSEEAYKKGFNPALFGYNTALHKLIKKVHNIPKRKYVVKKTKTSETKKDETDIDNVLSEIEDDIASLKFDEARHKLKKNKNRIPSNFYNTIMKSID